MTEFLNFARPQDLHLVKVDLRAIVEACAHELESLLNENAIELRVEGEFPQLAGDQSLLRRALVNLVRNGVEAIDSSALSKLIVITGAVEGSSDHGYAHVRICDTGGGIPPEDLNRIFIPFFTTKSRGYGIGLALVQKIVVAHGGDVAVERSDSSGTVFHCRLPLTSAVPVEPEVE